MATKESIGGRCCWPLTSRGHAFYDRLQQILRQFRFDAFVEKLCQSYYADKGHPSIPPGRYFRMHFVGYFEGIDSERGIEWRCADSLSLRGGAARISPGPFLTEPHAFPAAATHSRRSLCPSSQDVGQGGFGPGGIGVDASTMEANAALRTIVRRDTGESYRQMLLRMAKGSGIVAPTVDDLVRLDRQRKDKSLSNKDWRSPVDPEAKVAKMKDGRTWPTSRQHAVDLDSGAVIAAEIHEADQGDTTTLGKTLKVAEDNLKQVSKTPPCTDDPVDLVADEGYFSRDVLKELDGSPWRSWIAEPKRQGLNVWNGDHEARRAVYNNRIRLGSLVGKCPGRQRTEVVERSFEHTLDRCGGMRRVWLRGRVNVQKRYLIHVAGFNLGLLMRAKIGCGTPRGWAEAWFVVIWTEQIPTTVYLGLMLCLENQSCIILPLACIHSLN